MATIMKTTHRVQIESGLLLIVDAAVGLGAEPGDDVNPKTPYGRACQTRTSAPLSIPSEIGDIEAVVVGGFAGDGFYYVEVFRDQSGRVEKVVITF